MLKSYSFINLETEDFIRDSSGDPLKFDFKNTSMAMRWIDQYLKSEYEGAPYGRRMPSVKAFCWADHK